MKMVKCLPEFHCFTVFLKNRNFISKIRISKVTDFATLNAGLLLDNFFLKICLSRKQVGYQTL